MQAVLKGVFIPVDAGRRGKVTAGRSSEVAPLLHGARGRSSNRLLTSDNRHYVSAGRELCPEAGGNGRTGNRLREGPKKKLTLTLRHPLKCP